MEKKKYIHKYIEFGIFRISIYKLGWHKFTLRLEISWGWNGKR